MAEILADPGKQEFLRAALQVRFGSDTVTIRLGPPCGKQLTDGAVVVTARGLGGVLWVYEQPLDTSRWAAYGAPTDLAANIARNVHNAYVNLF